MHIINAMFGKGLGGIEQSLIDYCNAALMEGDKVTAITQPGAAINRQVKKLSDVNHEMIRNFSKWDILASYRLKKFLKNTKPDAIIAHGNRAAFLIKNAAQRISPVIGVSHNSNIQKVAGLDAIFATTDYLKKTLASQSNSKLYHIPNMYKLENLSPTNKSFRKPPIIGSMGRFAKKKGFINFIKSLKILNDKGSPFIAYLGGAGEQQENLKKFVRQQGLSGKVHFLGWVKDKQHFFNSIDVFCIPSIVESFGIVLLEAFANRVTVITTNADGPSEIATDNYDALIVEKENPQQMADAIKSVIEDQDKAYYLADNGFVTFKNNYEMSVVSKKCKAAITEIVANYNAKL